MPVIEEEDEDALFKAHYMFHSAGDLSSAI